MFLESVIVGLYADTLDDVIARHLCEVWRVSRPTQSR